MSTDEAHQRIRRLSKHFDIKIPRINKHKSWMEIHLIIYYWTWFGNKLCKCLHCRDWNVSSLQQAIQYDLFILNCHIIGNTYSCTVLSTASGTMLSVVIYWNTFACSMKPRLTSFSILCSLPSQHAAWIKNLTLLFNTLLALNPAVIRQKTSHTQWNADKLASGIN